MKSEESGFESFGTFPNGSASFPLDPDVRIYRGRINSHCSGTISIEFAIPRPVRIWIGEMLLVNEDLFRHTFQRQVRGVILAPCEKGALDFRMEVGIRPTHLKTVDEHCPSRNRAHVMKRLAEEIPDRLEISVEIYQAVSCPAISMRFCAAQFSFQGIRYQQLLVRSADESIRLSLNESVLLLTHNPVKETDATQRNYPIPIGTVGTFDPPLRSSDSDNRAEPSLEPVRCTVIQVRFEKDVIDVVMPVYESPGRNAPVKEFHPLQWPAYSEVKDKLPKPILPASSEYLLDLYDEAWRMLFRLVRHPEIESGIRNPYISTGSNFTHSQFVWDTSFTTIAAAYGSHVIPILATIDLLYASQQDGGYIHREIDTRDALPFLYEPDFSPNPPILSIAEWTVACITGDMDRLRQVYVPLTEYHEWLVVHRRLSDGTYWTTGLANGLDNSPSLGEGYPCLTAQMAHDAETLGKIAAAIGLDEDAKKWQEEYGRTVCALNDRLWDAESGFYASSLLGGGHSAEKVVTGFWPLWAGAVPDDRVRLLANHLKDPGSFWRCHPIPSLAADSSLFVPGGDYWLGSAWAPTNYAVIKGFDRQGRHDLALEATLRHLECMWTVLKDTGSIWENYCSEECARGSVSMKDYCWSALGPIALLIEIVLGIQVDALHDMILWRIPEESGIGIRNLPFGQGEVHLLHMKKDDTSRVEVSSNRSFDLCVIHKGRTSKHGIRPGSSVIIIDTIP